MMYSNEERARNQSRFNQSNPTNQISSLRPPASGEPYHRMEDRAGRVGNSPVPPGPEWKTASVLDAANNKLQELMQLLYLLSRDPVVPSDARYHVTVAQSEIALLIRLMQNSAEAAAANQLPADRAALAAGNP